MNLAKTLLDVGRRALRRSYTVLPLQGLTGPVFIVGCGRSGTTILGKSLSKHRNVTYLNEPRDLWYSTYPETDIWTTRAPSRGGRLELTAEDAEAKKSQRIRRLFKFETTVDHSSVLIEKLPANDFRLSFLREVFPNARFIHIFRNGLEVARSIERLAARGAWFGAGNYKWKKLVEYAVSKDDTKKLPALCSCDFDRGLLEWRLSTEAVVGFLHHLPDDAFLELSYDQLAKTPVRTVSEVLQFIGIESDPQVETFVDENLARRSSELGQASLSEKERTLGGRLLPLSMDTVHDLTGRSRALDLAEAAPGLDLER